MKYEVEVDVKSPTVVAADRATGNVLDTLPYLPGTVLRGALAAAYLRRQGKAAGDGSFQELFLGKTRIGDCRTDGADTMPFSARACKDDPEGRHHDLVDFLLGAGTPSLARLPMECAVCRVKLGYPYPFLKWQHGRGMAIRSRTRRVAHVEIDAERLRAKPGQFYTSRVLEAGTRMRGTIRADGIAAESLEELIGDGVDLGIGRGRTRGQGVVRLRFLREREAEIDAGKMAGQIRAFQRGARSFDASYSGWLLFSVALQSPAILLDKWMFGTSDLQAADLDSRLASYEMLAAFCGLSPVSGWHARAGMPKGDADAAAAGSTYLFGMRVAAGEEDRETEVLSRVLSEVVAAGIGERRQEGFGEIGVCGEFFWRHAARKKVSDGE